MLPGTLTCHCRSHCNSQLVCVTALNYLIRNLTNHTIQGPKSRRFGSYCSMPMALRLLLLKQTQTDSNTAACWEYLGTRPYYMYRIHRWLHTWPIHCAAPCNPSNAFAAPFRPVHNKWVQALSHRRSIQPCLAMTDSHCSETCSLEDVVSIRRFLDLQAFAYRRLCHQSFHLLGALVAALLS
jgi:hypothetical protein